MKYKNRQKVLVARIKHWETISKGKVVQVLKSQALRRSKREGFNPSHFLIFMKKYVIIVYPDKRISRPFRAADLVIDCSIKEHVQTKFSQWRILIWTNNYFVLCSDDTTIRIDYFKRRRINSHGHN